MTLGATLQRNGGSLARQLRRETLALRVIVVTTRIALKELDRIPAGGDQRAWASQLAEWVAGVVDYHRNRIEQMRRRIAFPDPGQTADEMASLLGDLELALADAEEIADETRRLCERDPS